MTERTAEGYKETILKNLQDTIALLSSNQPPYHLLKESIQTTQKILDHINAAAFVDKPDEKIKRYTQADLLIDDLNERIKQHQIIRKQRR